MTCPYTWLASTWKLQHFHAPKAAQVELKFFSFYLSTQLSAVERRASECMNEVWWHQVNSDLQPGVNPSVPPSLQQQRSGGEWSGAKK